MADFQKQINFILGFLVLVVLAFLPTVSFPAQLDFPNKLQLLQSHRDSRFEALEAKLSTYRHVYETQRTKETEDVLIFALHSFSNLDPALGEKLSQWVGRMPKSYLARMARGYYYRTLGHFFRGEGYPRMFQSEQGSKMRDYFRKAILDFSKALSLHPELGVAFGGLMTIAMIKGDRETLEDLFKRAIKIDPTSFDIRRRYIFSLQPKWGGSLEQMKAFIDSSKPFVSKNPGLKILRGYLPFTQADRLAISDRRRKAIEFYNQALDLGKYWWFYYERGSNYYLLGEHEKAVADFNNALQLWPQHWRILNAKGWTYRDQKRPELSMENFNLALQFNTFHPISLRGRTLLLDDKGKFKEAMQEIEKAMIFGAHNGYVWWTKGRLQLYRLKMPGKAVDTLRRATELTPNDASIWHDYGGALYEIIDCGCIGALDKYLTLCESGQSCTKEGQKWAWGVVSTLGSSFTCPRVFLYPRHIWRFLWKWI